MTLILLGYNIFTIILLGYNILNNCNVPNIVHILNIFKRHKHFLRATKHNHKFWTKGTKERSNQPHPGWRLHQSFQLAKESAKFTVKVSKTLSH